MKPTAIVSIMQFLIVIYPFLISAQQRSYRGVTEPYRFATISATVPGRIAAIKGEEGAWIKKGDVILELEKEEQELETSLRKLVYESKVEVTAAQLQAHTLQLDYQSTKQLFDSSKSVSEEELRKKELEYKQAVAEFDRLTILEKKEELEYKIAQAQLQHRIITAPFDGIVVKHFLKLGESCNAQEPLVRIVDISRCRFLTYLEATASHALKAGAKVSLTIGAGAAPKMFQGTIEYVSPVVDPSSGLREIKVVFANPGGVIQPGVSGMLIIDSNPEDKK
jgi:RND family efflux transporter MFP subunit